MTKIKKKKNPKCTGSMGSFLSLLTGAPIFHLALGKKTTQYQKICVNIQQKRYSTRKHVVPVHVNSNKMGSSIPKLICPYPKLKGKRENYSCLLNFKVFTVILYSKFLCQMILEQCIFKIIIINNLNKGENKIQSIS